MQQQQMTPQEVLYEVVHVLFKWKIFVCLAFVTTFIGIIGGTYLTTPRWKATTKLLVERNPRLQPVIFKDLVEPGEITHKVTPSSSMIEMLAGREMAQEAVERFQLDERMRKRENEPEEIRYVARYWINKILIDYPKGVFIALGLLEEEEKDYLALAVADFMKDWEDFASAESSAIISLGIWAESPELATEICAFMVERLQARTMDLTASRISTTYDFAKAQMPMVTGKLHAAEENVRAFKRAHSITEFDETIRMKMVRLGEVETDITDVEIERRANSERLKELRTHLDKQEIKIIEAGFIAGNSYILNLKTTIADLNAELSSMLTEKKGKHPDVVSLQRRIDESKDILGQEIQRIVRSETETMSPIYQGLAERLINAEIDEFLISVRWLALNSLKENLESDLLDLSDKKTGFDRLVRKKEILEKLHRSFEMQLEELQILNHSAVNETSIRVIDRGYVPASAEPSWPSLKIAVVVGFMVSLSFALVVPFVLEFWTDSVRAWQVKRILEKPVLGELFRG